LNSEQFLSWCAQFVPPSSSVSYKRPLIMGILNVTPDSFSDAGLYFSQEKACAQALAMIEAGADIIDIGGESSRPGAPIVSKEEELARVIPVIETLVKQTDVCLSIDTNKPEVMRHAVKAGVTLINDICALQSPGALKAASELGVPICLMHMQGTPRTMQVNPVYPEGVMKELVHFFKERINACLAMGITKSQLIIDPGFGFGKTTDDNLKILHNLAILHEFSLPQLLGVSRKSTIGALLNKPKDERVIGGVAIAVYAALKGVGIIRTHDVEETKQALQILDGIAHVQ
jgi:dihydropteroate synthase